jgi:hypothetical protein
MISLYSIFEQAYARINNKAEPQEVVRACINAYATFAKLSFYEGKQFENSPIDGSFFFVYKGIEIEKDDLGYFITAPSTYLLLPHEFGIKFVDFDGCKKGFVQVANYAMLDGLKAQTLGGRKVYEVIESQFRLQNTTAADLVVESGKPPRTMWVQIAIAMDDLDVDTPRNIAPNIVQSIVDTVVTQFSPKEATVPDKIN